MVIIMKDKAIFILIFLLSSYAIIPISLMVTKNTNAVKNSYKNSPLKNEHIINNELSPAKNLSDIEINRSKPINIAAIGSDPPSWHDKSYNYRINITISEKSGLARENWPVDVYVEFNPWANKDGIKVVNETGDVVKFQIWNKTGNSTHIAKATITFLADVPANGLSRYFVYYDVKPVGTPSFPTEVTLSITTDSATGDYIYTIFGETYQKVVMSPRSTYGSSYIYTGGQIVEVIESGTGSNLFNEPMDQLGIIRNGDLYNPLGTANSKYQPENKFIVDETKNGPLFIMYKVINAPIYDNNNYLIAKANLTYRFYKNGWIVEANVIWLNDDPQQNSTYWIGSYMFDQDDGSDVSFDRVGTPSGNYVLGEGLPRTLSGVIKDWGKVDLSDKLRVFITPKLVENVHYSVELTWDVDVDVDLDVFIFSERGFLIEGYDDLWDKLDDSAIGNQDYSETETATATVNESWIIVVLGYCDPSGNSQTASFTITLKNSSATVATFSGTINSYVYLDRYVAYCNYHDDNYPNTIDEDKEGNVNYWIGGYAKRYFADDELATFILPMPLSGGDDYYIELSWDLEYSDLHYYIYNPDGTFWVKDTSGNMPPINETLYPSTGGNYVVVIHYYDGSYYDSDDDSAYDDTSIDLYFEPPFAETEDYYDSSSSWNWVSFYHHSYPRCIGLVNISIEYSLDLSATSTRDIYWGNKGEGVSSDDDYILWAIRITGVNAKKDQWLRYKYGVFLFSANESSLVNYYAERLRAPLEISTYPIERYRLIINYYVYDGDNLAISGANVDLINETSGEVIASSTTNSFGIASIDVPRYSDYRVNITLVSGGRNYSILDDVDYSGIPYTTHSIARSYTFSNLVKISIKCVDSENRTLQNAYLSLNESYISEYSDLLGYINLYVPKGAWNLTISYRFAYDQFNLTYLNGTFVKDVDGYNVSLVKYAVLNIDKGASWLLYDLDATAPLPLVIELREGQLSYDVVWGDNISLKVAILSSNNLVEAEDNVTWRIVFRENESIVPGFGVTKATRLSKGIYGINVSTHYLPAGLTYLLIINASVTNYQTPVPLAISIRVNARPTTLELISLTTNIFWYERFEAQVRYIDALTGDFLPNAKLEIFISGPVKRSFDLVYSDNAYSIIISNFKDPTGAYTITIRGWVGNYSVAEFTTSLIVNPRPTDIRAPSIIELRWSPTTYNVSIEFYDSRNSTIVSEAETFFRIMDTELGTVFVNGSLIENNYYLLSIPLLKLSLGSYVSIVSLGKRFYENKTISISLSILAIRTYATSNITHLSVYWGDIVHVGCKYMNTETYPATEIANATATFKVIPFGQQNPVLTGELTYLNKTKEYLLNLDTKDIGLGEYKIKVTLFMKNYSSQSVEIDLEVNPLVGLVIAPDTIDLVWGESISFEVKVLDALTGEGLENFSYYAEMIGVGNVTANLAYRGNGILFFNYSDTTNLAPSQYSLMIKISKLNYVIETKYVTVNINDLDIRLSLCAYPESVQKIPFVSLREEQKKIEVLAYDYSHDKPLENARIIYNITYGLKVFMVGELEEISPGVYSIVIPWEKADIGNYRVGIYISKISIDGKLIEPRTRIALTGLTTTVEWYGGTLWGMPAIILVPSLFTIVAIASFLGYKYYLYFSLPIEVREIDKLLKMIQRKIYEYEYIPREEIISEIIKKELDLI